MLNGIYYTILVINIIMVLLKKKPKLVLLVNILFVIVLVTGTLKTNDYAIYKLMYDSGYARSFIEIGYNFLMDLSHRIGLSFDQFWRCCYFFFGFIYLWVFSQYSSNYPLLFSLYYIHLLFVDICQIRSFYAGALLLLALHFLFNGKKVKFVVFAILSTLIHTEVLFFLPLVFIDFENKLSIRFVKRLSIIILAICAIVFILGTRISVLSNLGIRILLYLGAESKIMYLTTTSHYGFILYFMLHLVTLMMTYYGKKNLRLAFTDEAYPQIIDKVMTLQLYCVISFPLIMINMSFYRLYRLISIMNYICWAVILDSMKVTGRYYRALLAMYFSAGLYRIPLVHGNSQVELILNNNKYFR